MQSFIIAKKELTLLIRDKLTATVLFVLPFAMILILGLLLGEGFGQKTDDLMRISILNLDKGFGLNNKPWAQNAIEDMVSTPNIKVEIIQNDQGNRITPSYVAWTTEGERLIGDSASVMRTDFMGEMISILNGPIFNTV